jgi:hypothetical protein
VKRIEGMWVEEERSCAELGFSPARILLSCIKKSKRIVRT